MACVQPVPSTLLQYDMNATWNHSEDARDEGDVHACEQRPCRQERHPGARRRVDAGFRAVGRGPARAQCLYRRRCRARHDDALRHVRSGLFPRAGGSRHRRSARRGRLTDRSWRRPIPARRRVGRGRSSWVRLRQFSARVWRCAIGRSRAGLRHHQWDERLAGLFRRLRDLCRLVSQRWGGHGGRDAGGAARAGTPARNGDGEQDEERGGRGS